MSCSFYLLPGFPGSKEVPERSRGVAECSVFPGISRFPILEGKKKKTVLKVKHERFVYLPYPSTHISFLNKMLSWWS